MKETKTKIAVCIPIGALDKYGYQYIWREVLANQSKAFDKVYLYTTIRANINLDVGIENVELVIIDDVLLDLDANGNELFSIYKIYNAYNQSLLKAKTDGMDFLFCSAINIYIDDVNALSMRNYLNGIKTQRKPFAYYAKAFQLYDKVCYPNSLLPLIANLDFIDDIKIDIDVMEYKGERYGWRGGHHTDFPFYIIDVFGVETLNDFEEKFNWYIKVYLMEWQNKDVSFEREIEIAKFKKKVSKVSINYKYSQKKYIEKFSGKIVADSLVRSIPFKTKSKYLLVLKSMILKTLEFLGLMKYIGNR
jgi:hypothetical protein